MIRGKKVIVVMRVYNAEDLASILSKSYEIGEVTCPTCYFDIASSINFSRSAKYGSRYENNPALPVEQMGWVKSRLFEGAESSKVKGESLQIRERLPYCFARFYRQEANSVSAFA